ncbi:MAG: hypothetical protein FWE76_05320 [Symbiobacteriaceae bacterium]|nr:hypothetical protein [Symbiobacteriaceae bacterium]
MPKDKKQIPAGTAFLVSALMIYPAFSAISVDLDRQVMRFDFQFSLEDNSLADCEALVLNVERGLRFAHQLMNVKASLTNLTHNATDRVFVATWERDMESLSEQEVDVVHELLLDFYEDHDIEIDESILDGEQFYHFERVFDELFHRVQEMDNSVRLRAYRDSGMIYVHSLPLTEGSSGS